MGCTQSQDNKKAVATKKVEEPQPYRSTRGRVATPYAKDTVKERFEDSDSEEGSRYVVTPYHKSSSTASFDTLVDSKKRLRGARRSYVATPHSKASTSHSSFAVSEEDPSME